MWKHLKNKTSRSGGYELSDIHECANIDDIHDNSVVILKRYTRISSNLQLNSASDNKNSNISTKLNKKCKNEGDECLMKIEDLTNNNNQTWPTDANTVNNNTNNDVNDISNNNVTHRKNNVIYENISALQQSLRKQNKPSPPKMKRRQKINNASEPSLNVTKEETLDPPIVYPREISPNRRIRSPSVDIGSRKSLPQTPYRMQDSPSKKPLYSKSKKESVQSLASGERSYRPPGPANISRSDLNRAILDTEPTHMSWEEVMEEAQLLGISLKSVSLMSQSADNDSTSRHHHPRLKHHKLQSKETASIFYSDTDECYGRQNPTKETTSMASSASSMGMRNSTVAVSSQTDKYTPQMFKGIVKLQNFFKRAERDDSQSCHCDSRRKSQSKNLSLNTSAKSQMECDKLASKTDKFSKFNLKEALFSSKLNEKLKKLTDRECQECKKQCRICRSLERVSTANKSNVSIPSSVSRFENESLMARSWQQESSFTEEMEAAKSMSLNRRLQHVTRIDSFSSIFPGPPERQFTPQPRRVPLNIEKFGYTPLEVISYYINPSENLKELKNVLWYWGTLNREGATKLLQGKPDGWFLVRNSSDERYALALSFRSEGETHHTGIECNNGTFSFHEPSPPVQDEASANNQPPLIKQRTESMSVIRFIEEASIKSRSDKDRYYLQPRSSKESIIPVKLWNAIFRPVESLMNLTADVILTSLTGPHSLLTLPVSSSLKGIIKNRLKTKTYA